MRIAINALFANKLRSLLTMLGIIIGVGAVIAMVAVGMGVTQRVTDSIASLGSNMLIIRPGASMSGGLRGAAGSRTTLKYEDAAAIKKKVKDVDYVSPTVQKNYQVVYGNQNWNTSVMGVTQEYMSIRDLKVMTGSFITEDDMNTRNRVAVIGMTVASNLFGEANPVGKTIRVNNQPYRVIGVLESKGQSSVGQDQDDVVIVPLTTAMDRLLAVTYVQTINVQVTSQSKMDEVQANIETPSDGLERRRLSGAEPDEPHDDDERDDDDADVVPWQYCRNFAYCRRHRHHEHHDGLRHRAHARDWHTKSARRDLQGHHDTVLDRIGRYWRHRRRTRHFLWNYCGAGYFQIRRLPDGHNSRADSPVLCFFRRHRPFLRHLSGAESGAPRPDRGAQIRITAFAIRRKKKPNVL